MRIDRSIPSFKMKGPKRPIPAHILNNFLIVLMIKIQKIIKKCVILLKDITIYKQNRITK